ncbi:MAG: MscL family protein [Patescibacteria group bacterium]
MKDFIKFIREQGVVGLAVGFILGGAISGVVSSIVKDLINPLLGLILGLAGGLQTSVLKIGSAELMIGNFISTLIDFILIALVVYFGVKILKLEKLDKKKD